MANITLSGPVGPGGSWPSYFASRVADLVDSQPELDHSQQRMIR